MKFYSQYSLSICLIICSCGSDNQEQNAIFEGENNKMQNSYKIPDNCDFSKIDHAFSSNSCSPKIIKPVFEGVIINMPKKIFSGSDMTAFLACSFSFSNKRDLGFFGNVRNEIVFTVVDAEHHTPQSGKVPGIQNPIPVPSPVHNNKYNKENNKENLPLQYLRGYVNLDVFQVINASKKPGVYLAYATISTYKSNIIQFEILEKNSNE